VTFPLYDRTNCLKTGVADLCLCCVFSTFLHLIPWSYSVKIRGGVVLCCSWEYHTKSQFLLFLSKANVLFVSAASESPPSLPSLIRVSVIQLKSQLRVVWCASFPLLFPCQVLVPRESLLTRENDELSCAEAENLKLRGESKCCQLVVTIYPPLSHPLPLPLGDLQEINARAW